MADRRAKAIFTLDRALLIGAIAVGGWIAKKDFSLDDIEARLKAQELQTVNLSQEQVTLKIDRAVLEARMGSLTAEVIRLREVIERRFP